jgi:hypothetical protein
MYKKYLYADVAELIEAVREEMSYRFNMCSQKNVQKIFICGCGGTY